MCELFAFSSNCEKNISGYLKKFYSHSDKHPDGWGLLEIKNGERILNLEPVCAAQSKILPDLIKPKMWGNTVLAHIRKATIGNIKIENCHPFIMKDISGRTWSLMHNGTIFEGIQLIGYEGAQVGDTDSERILMYIIDKINEAAYAKKSELNSYERFKIVENVIGELSYRNKLNLIIFDGSQLYVHVNMRETLFYTQQDGSVIISTQPLEDEGWKHVPMTTLLVYQDGELKFKGKNHYNEYHSSLNEICSEYDYVI